MHPPNTRRPLGTLFLVLMVIRMTALSLSANEIDVTLRFFPIQRQPVRNLYYVNPEGEFELIRFRSRLRSDDYPYRGPARVPFFRPAAEPDPETGLPRFEEVATITLEQNTGEVLLFFMEPRNQEEPGQEPWRILAVDDGPQSFPHGHLRVLNASGVTLDGFVGDNQLTLGFDVSRPLPLHSGGANGQSVQVFFALNLGVGHEMVYANRLFFPATGRSIMVLRPPRRRGSIQIDSFLLEDSIPEPEAELTPDE